MRKLIPHLQSASALLNYKLLLNFEDGVQGTIDLSKWKGLGVFEYWNIEDNFRTFKITEDRKIQWNEEIDMDPDAFYLELIGKTFEEYAGDKHVLWHSY